MDEQPETVLRAPAGESGFPRSVLIAGAGIVALVVLALVVAVVLPDQPTEYPAGSPEAAFQTYYDAWENDDLETAYGAFSSNVTSEMDLSEYRRMDAEYGWQREQDQRLVLLGVEVDGDRATLTIRVDQFSEGGIGGNRYAYERTVRLVDENGSWSIDEPLVGIESVPYGY